MNNKDWNDNEDFWDDEAENDDDEYNDFGNDNIDANNDDTFANTSEWNEDEHEEMIARDSILSHTMHRNNTNRNSCVNRNNNHNNHNQNPHDSQHRTNNGSNTIQTTSDLDTLLRALGSHNNGVQATSTSSTWIPAQGEIIPSDLVASILGMAGPSDGPDQDAWISSSSRDFAVENQVLGRSRVTDNIGAPKALSAWQQPFEGVDRIRQAQLQRQLQLQQQLLLQAQMHEREQLIRSMQLREELQQQQQQQQRLASQNQLRQFQLQQEQQIRQHQAIQQAASINLLRSMQRDGTPLKVLTVDELEKQLVKTNNQPLPQQSLSMNHDIRHQPIGSPVQTQHNQQRRAAWGPFDTAPPKVLTVDELEKQLVKTSISQQPQQKMQPKPHDIKRQTTGPQREHQNQHNRAVWNRFETDKSDAWSHSDNHSGRRENRRDYFRHHHKRETTIIPPQVQLQVIDKIKSLHPLKSMQPDEFLVDRMPGPEGTIQSKKHSLNSGLKEKHDGILTEQERNWLTKVQKKIQADCDENLDQDYYYLSYFNRSSMTNEAANRPSGPSVLDKRFIPRERLLYNSSAL